MALIKCTGCGHDVSDKATECPHCGHPISQERRNICKECGEPIPENASICPNCGCPIENNEAVQEVVYEEEPQKKKWWIWALVAALLCLIGGGYYAYSKLFNGGSGKNVIVELTPEFVNAIQKYEKLGSFNEGLAPVLRNGKWGFINTKGEEVIPCQYPNPYEDFTASPFYEGMALVQKDGKWGFINTKGEEVIPISIEAESIGRFSEGMAFVYIDEENFSVINKEGKTVFKGKADFSWYLGPDVASELLPVYSQGNICVPLEPDKFAVYDNQGNKIREINQESRDELDKQNETKPYTIFIKENGDDEDNQYNTVGLKAANGTELIPAIYDGIGNVGAGEKIDAPNGVVLVILDEIGEDAIEGYGGEFDSPDTKRHYGYADLKGNDTFSNEIKEKCRETKEKALQKIKEQREAEEIFDIQSQRLHDRAMELDEESSDWLQGHWVGTDSGSGYPLEVIVDGNNLIQKINGQVCYNGSFQFNGKFIVYNDGNDFWPVDNERQVLTYNGSPMRKENGSSSQSSSNSYSNNSSSSGSGYRFSSEQDVIGWLADKSFYNGSRRLRIRPDGVFLNDYCATFAPRVERWESWKALIRANTATGQRLSFLVDPIHGTITDEESDVFRLR